MSPRDGTTGDAGAARAVSLLLGVPRAAARLIGRGWRALLATASHVFLWTESWLLDSKKSLYGLAVTRIVLGLTGAGLLLTNFSTRFYTFGSGSAWNGEAAQPVSDFTGIWLFSLFHNVRLDDGVFTVLYLLLLVLAVVFALGWRFKIVLPVYFVLWVSFIEMNDAVGDQGDNMYRIVLLVLFFADPAARWSLDARRRARAGDRTILPREISSLLHNLALVALTAQVCFVYASGGLYKAGGEPWSGGYAVYAPLMTERFGTWPVLSDLVTAWGPAVAAISWGSVILQVAFPLMLLTRPTRIVALLGIMSFHIGIGVLMGLPWFSLAMIGIDFIFIRDRTWLRLSRAVRESFRRDDDRADDDGPAEDALRARDEVQAEGDALSPHVAPHPPGSEDRDLAEEPELVEEEGREPVRAEAGARG